MVICIQIGAFCHKKVRMISNYKYGFLNGVHWGLCRDDKFLTTIHGLLVMITLYFDYKMASVNRKWYVIDRKSVYRR